MEVGWNVFTLASLSPPVAASFKGSLPFSAVKATERDGLIDRPQIAAHYHLHYILKKDEEVQTSESKVPICESQRQRVRKSGRLISKWEVESPRRQTLFPVRECHTPTLFWLSYRRLCILVRFKWHKYRCKRMTPLFCSSQAMRSES